MIPYAFAIVTLPTVGILADKLQRRFLPTLGCLAVSLIGFIIIMASTTKTVLLVGCCFIAAGSYPALIVAISWQMSSHAGYTKRSTAWAVSQIFIQCYSIISTQIYDEPPRFFKGHGTLLGLNAVGVVAALINYRLMKAENARRDRVAQEYLDQGLEDPDVAKSYEELCDRHPLFRYSL
jgi:MFS family permease